MHDELCEKAKKAISDVMSDTSVSPAITLESLSTLRDEIDIMIESLEVSD